MKQLIDLSARRLSSAARFILEHRTGIATGLYFVAGFLYSLGGVKPPKRKRR